MCLLAALFLRIIIGLPALAQQVPGSLEPGAIQKNSSNTQKYYELQKELEQNKKPASSQNNVKDQTKTKGQRAPKGKGKRFLLKRLEWTPSRILTAKEEEKLAGRYVGKEVDIQDLFALVDRINHLYQEKGYVAARAFLPPQKVIAGVVKIELIEGSVNKIVVKGNRHTRASYFTQRISLKPGDLVQVNKLRRDLEFFNMTNDTKMLATLRPGKKFGTTRLDLEVQPVNNYNTTVFYDNAGPDSVGRQRVGLSVSDKSVFGYRDPFTVGGYWADGTLAGYAFYNFPITIRGMRLGGGGSYSSIRVCSGPLQKFGIRGSSYDTFLRLSRPLVVHRTFVFTGFLSPHYISSTIRSSGFTISHILVRSLQVGGDFRAYDKHGFWYLINMLTVGNHSLGDGAFFTKYDLSVTRLQTIKHGWEAVFRAWGQVKAVGSVSLPPSEQFQIGGLSTVRGYPEGQLIGDSGYAVSCELDAPLPLGKTQFYGMSWSQRVKIAFFLDHGGIRQGDKNRYITGAGSGFIINLAPYLSARLYLAAPLQDRSNIDHLAFQFYVQSAPPFAQIARLF